MTVVERSGHRTEGTARHPPEALQRPGVAAPVLRRMRDWPQVPAHSPVSLVRRLSPHLLELRVGNVFPVGIPTLIFIVFFLPFSGWVVPKGLARDLVAAIGKGSVGYSVGNAILLLVALATALVMALFAYRADFQGAAGDGLTLFDRRDRKVYQRVHGNLVEGTLDWDGLHPYIETRNAISRVNQALTLVEFESGREQPRAFVTVEIVGTSEEPLIETHAFIHAFMERGIEVLPPVRLVASPDPGWYTNAPSWLLGLPRPLAKSVWSFAVLLFIWPVVVWSRLLRLVLPFSTWPAAIEAEIAADVAAATPAEAAWLAQHCTPAERPPWIARAAFVAAVAVSGPVWWAVVSAYGVKLFATV